MNIRKRLLQLITVILVGIMLVSCSNKEAPNVETTAASQAQKIEYQDKIKSLEKVTAKVKKVVDGDTLTVDIKGKETKIRMLLLDTPESVKPGEKQPMKYGKEASAYTKKLLEGKSVELFYDIGQKEDLYKRELAYVYLDGKCVEADILRQGLGVVRYVNKPSVTLYDDLKSAQEEAKKAKKGVWSIEGYVIERGQEAFYNAQKAS
ncbi:TPA: thermonuclease family protein [Bacillus cereus]|uniref:thermonuclease family protein n=1 Tax=Priestia endophytica TaxID=135735 RepID=UPI0029625CFA|nr:thermonuclease family protein [Bacillus thuringiensis]HEF7292997.1 thermonuclease family protein [Bacillus cereus]